MDPLAHSLFGAALARTRLGRDVPSAGVTLVVAANIPDVDVLAYFAGGDAALGFRRGWTHGPIGLLVLPVLWLFLLWLYRRWREASGGSDTAGQTPPSQAFSARLVGLVYLGALSHPALDYMNTYGVRFGMPFDRRWFYGDVLFIVDPWMWLLLGSAAFLGATRSRDSRSAARSRRLWLTLAAVASVVAMLAMPWAARGVWLAVLGAVVGLGRRERQWAATGGVALFGLYLSAMWIAAAAAHRATHGELTRMGVAPIESLMVGPVPGTPFRREVVVATPHELRFGTFRWWGGDRVELSEQRWVPLRVALSPTQTEAPLVAAALADPCIAGFVNWMRFPTAEVESTPGGTVVHLLDLRYTRERTKGFGGARVESALRSSPGQ